MPTWKQATADFVIEIVRSRDSLEFALRDLYGRMDEFRNLFPENHNIEAKIRQSLQVLRDDGFLLFGGDGNYRLNPDFEDLEIQVAGGPSEERILGPAPTRRRIVNIRLRDTLLVTELKKRYSYLCQVCTERLTIGRDRFYAEGHHMQPLGNPYNGPDVQENILITCPNHHVLFDRAAIAINPLSLRIEHFHFPDYLQGRPLQFLADHALSPTYLEFHYARFEALRRDAQ